MDLRFVPSTSLRLTSSPVLPPRSTNRRLVVRSSRTASPDDPQRGETKRALSHILRTEAAVVGVDRKARSSKTTTRLWPRAVLEALDDAVSNHRWDSALKIFALLRKQQWYQPRTQTYTKLLTMLGKCRQPERAAALFRVMLSDRLKPTLDVYTALVGAYGHAGRFDDALHVLDEMKAISDCRPDAYTYTALINCCCKLRRFDLIPALLSEMSYLGVQCSIVTYNAIIDGYGKAGLLDEMENALSDLLESGSCLPDKATMNSILWAYGNCSRIVEMERWYSEFQHMGVEADVTTFNILIKSYGKAGAYDKMVLVMKYMKKRFFSPTAATFNIIIESFGKAGNVEKMEYYFRLMKIQGVKPTSITYCSLATGYSKVGLLVKIPAIIRQTENTDVILDTPFFNSVISAYGQAGEVKIMEEMFFLMKEKKCWPDNITFATMIRAYDCLGMVDAAQDIELMMHNIENKAMETD